MGDREQRADARLAPLGLVGGEGGRPRPMQPDRGLSGHRVVEGAAPLGRHDRKARYSLIVTIETPETDIYTPISQDVSVQTEITT